MGSGKTTVGPLVAQRLGWSFVDVDDVIAAEAGLAIPKIFQRKREEAFRERERAAIARLAGGEGLVLALGGGAIEDADASVLLARRICWWCIWPWSSSQRLRVQAPNIYGRCLGEVNLASRYQRRLPVTAWRTCRFP